MATEYPSPVGTASNYQRIKVGFWLNNRNPLFLHKDSLENRSGESFSLIIIGLRRHMARIVEHLGDLEVGV